MTAQAPWDGFAFDVGHATAQSRPDYRNLAAGFPPKGFWVSLFCLTPPIACLFQSTLVSQILSQIIAWLHRNDWEVGAAKVAWS